MLVPMKSYLLSGTSAIVIVVILILVGNNIDAKDLKKDQVLSKGQGLCIARFESTGEPLYYTCPRPNESEKKSYCCYLDKCCDYKEFQKQTEQQYKMTQGNFQHFSKHAVGGILKVLLWIVFFIILLIVGCCCLVFLLCRKKKLFSDGIFNSPLPAQPPGPNIYTRPNQPYDWPETLQAQPAPPPSYPMYPSQSVSQPTYPVGQPPYPVSQPPYNPNYK